MESVRCLGASDFTIVEINSCIRNVFGNQIIYPESVENEIEFRDLFHVGSDANCSIYARGFKESRERGHFHVEMLNNYSPLPNLKNFSHRSHLFF